jgi:hypothetical protein
MIYYQPSQSLTWKYYTASGNLSIMSKIYLDLATNEKVIYTIVGPTNSKVLITLDVGSTGEFSPVTIEIPAVTIELGLTVNQVRDRIKILPVFEVRGTIYKNNVQEGEVINNTNAASAINMA